MSEYHPTTKEKIINAIWYNTYSSLAYMLISCALFIYDTHKVFLNLFLLDFILHPNYIVHMMWPWYISFPIGFACVFFVLRWIGPPPF